MVDTYIDGTNTENTIQLVKLNLKKAELEYQKQLNDLYNIKDKAVKDEIKHLEQQIAIQRELLKVGNNTNDQLREEINAKKVATKIYNEQSKVIKSSNSSIISMYKAYKDLNTSMKGAGFKDIRQYDVTFGSLLKNIKDLDFKKGATDFFAANYLAGVTKNTFPIMKSFSDGLARAAGGLYLLGKGAQLFYDNLILPSKQMRNLASQQLGVGYSNRNLGGGDGVSGWVSRTLMGVSAKDMQNIYGTLAGTFARTNFDYETMVKGAMANTQLWGINAQVYAKVLKPYQQLGFSAEKLTERFNELMLGIEGTGWTTTEYSNLLAQNGIYLKQFGVNLDTYSKAMARYGNLVNREIISANELNASKMQGTTSQRAFLAQRLLDTGLVTREELKVGKDATMLDLAGAMSEWYIADKAKRTEKLYKLFQSDPMMSGLKGAANTRFGEIEIIRNLFPLLGQNMIGANASAAEQMNIFQGRYGSTVGTQSIKSESFQQILTNAEFQNAQLSGLWKGMMVAVASYIDTTTKANERLSRDFQSIAHSDKAKGFDTNK